MYGDLGVRLIRDAQRIQNLPQIPTYASDLVTSLIREVHSLERSNDDLLAILQLARDEADYDDAMSIGGDSEDEEESKPKTDTKPWFDPRTDPGMACALFVNHLAIGRNKRCLLAYHRVRTGRVEAACWAGRDIRGDGGMLGSGSGGAGGGDGGADQLLQPPQSHNNGQSQNSSEDQRQRHLSFPEDDRSNPVPLANLSPEEVDYARKFSDLLAAYKGPFTDVDLTGSLEPPGDLFIDVRVIRDAGAVETEYGTINLTKNSQFFVRHADVEQLLQLGYLQKIN